MALNLNKPLSVVGVVIGAVVILLILGELADDLFNAIADFVGVFSTGTTNNTIADALLPILGTLVALGIVFGLIALVFRSTRFGGGGKGGY